MTSRLRTWPVKADIGCRTRALIWHAMVVSISKLSNRKLDSLYAEIDPTGIRRDIGRTEAFAQIGRLARDPNWFVKNPTQRADGKQSRRGFSLVESVARNPELAITKAVYFSELWRFLIPPPLNQPELQRILRVLIKRLGMFRATFMQIPLGELPNNILDHAAFDIFPSKAYTQAIRTLETRAAIDDLALLAALYTEAIRSAEIEIAVTVRKAIRKASKRFLDRYNIQRLPRYLFIALIEQRLLRHANDGRFEATATKMAEQFLKKNSRNHGHFSKSHSRFAHDAHALLLPQLPVNAAQFPVVSADSQLRQYLGNRKNRHIIEKIYKGILLLEMVDAQSTDSGKGALNALSDYFFESNSTKHQARHKIVDHVKNDPMRLMGRRSKS